ncbi:MAG: tetratricopeptide repeat protein [Acidobacteriota bacterium]
MRKRLRALVVGPMQAMEGGSVSPIAWTAGFLGIVFLRHFLELLAARNPVYRFPEFFLHYPLAYLAPLLALTLVLSWFSGERIAKVTRLMLWVWCLTLVPPLIQFPGGGPEQAVIFYGIPVDRLGYPLPMEGADYLARLGLFFSPFHRFPGTTWGIRLETLAACLLTLWYVRIKGKSWIRGTAGAAGVYLTALGFFHLPMLFYSGAGTVLFPRADLQSFYAGTGIIPRGAADGRYAQVCIFYLILLTLILGMFWLRRYSRDGLREIVRRRIDPWVFWLPVASLPGLLVGAATLIPAAGTVTPVPYDLFALAAVPLSIFLAGAAYVWIPDGQAGGGPGISGADRLETPVGHGLAGAALVLAWVAGYDCLAAVAAILGIQVLPNRRPFLLRNYPGLGAVGAAVAALLATLAGFALFAREEAAALLPRELILLSVLGYFPALVAVDLVRVGGRARRIAPWLPALTGAAIPWFLGKPVSWVILGSGAGLLCGWFLGRLPEMGTWLATAGPPLCGFLLLALPPPTDLGELRQRMFSSPRFHARQAQALEGAGSLEAALEARRQVVRLAPEDSRAHYNLGVILARLGRNDQAAEAFRSSLERDADFPEAHDNLAQVYLVLGNRREAGREIHQAIRLWERYLEEGNPAAAERRRIRDKIRQLLADLPPSVEEDQGSR